MIFYILIISCIIFQAERGIFDLLSYLKLFKQLDERDLNKSEKLKRTLYILIPVLNEQEIIEDTILNILKIKKTFFKINIVVLTTIQEKINNKNNHFSTTEDVIKNSIKSGKLAAFKDDIQIFQDPDVNGKMATQLNYAINKLKNTTKQSSYYLTLNADSIISSSTFEQLSALIDKNNGKEFAFQQPCAFVRDMGNKTNQFTNAMSLYQSWYCLGHESRLIRNYNNRSIKNWGKKNNTKLGVVVGHGSGMTLNINLENGGYPSKLMTEDLTFGFNLSANSVPILSLPALELADVPNKFTVFIKQKSVWFWNFLGYASCYKDGIKRGHSKYRLFLLLMQGVGAGAYWFFDTFFIIIPLIVGIIKNSYWIVLLSLISFFTFYILPQYVLFLKLPKVLSSQSFYKKAKDLKKVSFVKLLPSLCLIIFTNSVGTWIASAKYTKYLFTDRMPGKYKTGD